MNICVCRRKNFIPVIRYSGGILNVPGFPLFTVLLATFSLFQVSSTFVLDMFSGLFTLY